MRGIEELTTTTPAETASVLLMTDGLANNGIRDTDGIVRCMQGVLGEKPNFTVFTNEAPRSCKQGITRTLNMTD